MNSDEYFYRVGKEILQAEGYIHPSTGECVKMSLADKMVYSVLREECKSFERNGMECFLSQSTVSERSGVSRMSTNVFLKEMEECGVISTSPHKISNGKYTKQYIWKEDLVFYSKGGASMQAPDW